MLKIFFICIFVAGCSSISKTDKKHHLKKNITPPKVSYSCQGVASNVILLDENHLQKCEKTILKTPEGKVIEFENILTGNWGTHNFHTIRRIYKDFALVDATGTETVDSMIVDLKNRQKFGIESGGVPIFSPDKSKFYIFNNKG